jgi:hypothetical protein
VYLAPTTARAFDVAARLSELLPEATAVKIHKLLDYVQGYHLAWHGRPSPRPSRPGSTALSWRSRGENEKVRTPREPASIKPDILDVAYMRVSCYEDLAAKDPIKFTLSENSWRELSERADETTGPNTPISHEARAALFSRGDHLTPEVCDHVAEVATGNSEVSTGASELDDLEAGRSPS